MQIRRLGAVLALMIALAAPAWAEQLDFSVLRAVPIQSGGRVKPLDTFARQAVFQVTGKERFEKRDPVEVIVSWAALPVQSRKLDVIDVSHKALRQALELPADARRVSLATLVDNARLAELGRAAMQRQQEDQDLTELDKHVLRLMSRMDVFSNITSGEAFTIVPHATEPKGPWSSLLSTDRADARKLVEDFRDMLEAYEKKDNCVMVDASKRVLAGVQALGGPPPGALDTELRYNDLNPFGKAWMVYLGAFLVLMAAGLLRRGDGTSPLFWLGFAMAVGGLILHAYGFFLRCTVAERPPVTNMYESVIWVSFGAMVLALVLEAAHRTRLLLMSALVAVIVCLILADNTASILDPAINPLVPVLRSNFWLTIHVLTITASYAAFMVAMAQGHIALWQYAFHPENRVLLKSLHQQIYRAIQVGVLLLAAGTILGGVWANYSWGRFWGWDPKEVWALIALLGYLAILHGRYAGWIKEFGMAAGAIVAFQGVLMAWYGVNFVLGAGLHAYGFGDGGQQYVAMAVALDMLYVVWAARKYKRAVLQARGDRG